MVLISFDFPPDIRVEKEARALLAAGHELTLVCENRRDRQPFGRWNGIDIVRLPRQPLWWRRLNTAALFIVHGNPFWEWHIRRIAQTVEAEVMHVHDLPFVGPGLRIAHSLGIPLVADLHETYPEYLKLRQQLAENLIERIAFDPGQFARYERRIVPQCDAVITVVEEAAARMRELGADDSRITVVGNTEDVQVPVQWDEAVQLPASDLRLLYVGGIDPHRGLETVVRAMPIVLQRVPTASLVVVGDGLTLPSLRRLALDLGLGDAVRLEGRQPYAKVHTYMRMCHVCLVPHVANSFTDTTMPHKLFQYMFAERPVIVSSAKPLARVVREADCGLVFESGSPESFAKAVFALQDESFRQQLGRNGYQAVVDRYNWQRDGRRLVDLYQALQQRSNA